MYRNANAERIRAGLTLEQLAEKMDSYPSIWSEKLNGKRPILLSEAKKYKEVVKSKLPLEELFEEFEEAI
jgi:transcriptional regulator with XRE-family HTH domain